MELFNLSFCGFELPYDLGGINDELLLAAPKSWSELAKHAGSLKNRHQEFFNIAALATTLPRGSSSHNLQILALKIAATKGFEYLFQGKDIFDGFKDLIWTSKNNLDCSTFINLGARAACKEPAITEVASFEGPENLQHRLWEAIYVGGLVKNFADTARAQTITANVWASDSERSLLVNITGGEEQIPDRIIYGSGTLFRHLTEANYFTPATDTVVDIVEEEVGILSENARKNLMDTMNFLRKGDVPVNPT